MKKLLAVLIAVMLVLGCTTVAFAANTATADEPRTLESIEFTKLPDKLSYELYEDASWKIDGVDIDELDFDFDDLTDEEFLNILAEAEFYINIDLSGAEVTATYSDGSTEVIDNSLCTVSIADPASISDYLTKVMELEKKLEDMSFLFDDDTDIDLSPEELQELLEEYLAILEAYLNELNGFILRDYTINVDYCGAQTTFTVSVTEPSFEWDDNFDDYEFVSLNDPNPKTYYLSKDFEEEVLDEEENYIGYFLNFDTSEMEVTVRNTETEELFTISGEDKINIYFSYYSDEDVPETGTYTALGSVYDDELGCYVDFDYEFQLVNDLDDTGSEEETTTPQKTDSKDTTDKKTKPADNGAIKTGENFALIAVLYTTLSAAALCFVYFKRRKS